MLPTKLRKEPLLEAIFEMRFRAGYPASNVLPGLLVSKLNGTSKSSITRLPAADLPQPLRNIDPNLRYAPLVRINWDRFTILVGDQSLAVACTLPYPGWGTFKPGIIRIVSLIDDHLIEAIERYSLKYVDMIPAALGPASSLLDISLRVGPHNIIDQNFLIRVEIPKDDILHIVQLTSSANARLADGTMRDGLVSDIDSIVLTPNTSFSELRSELSEKIEFVHSENKTMFFACLQQGTIDKMEPQYD